MERIIDGVLYEGKTLPDSWDLRTFEVNGHRETSVRPAVQWVEVCNVLPYSRENMGDGYKGSPTAENLADWAAQDAADAESRRVSCLKKSAARAKTMCRRVIKAESFNEMLTLTYRENQNDRELCKVHFKEWYRRMKKALGGFRFCASFELQERGAMHVHVATHKLPESALLKGVKVQAWRVGTLIWRDIVGHEMCGPLLPSKDGLKRPKIDNGLCFVGGKTSHGAPRRRHAMSIGKMASYVSKYILKDFELCPEEKNRYSRSNGTLVPKPVLVKLHGMTLLEVLDLAFHCGDGDVILSHRIGSMKDSYWLVTEKLPIYQTN